MAALGYRRRKLQRQTWLNSAILVLSFSLGAVLCLEANTGEKTIYGQKVASEVSLVEVNPRLCLGSVASIAAGNFFESLERVEAENGPAFKKAQQVVQRFPADMTLEVSINVTRCHMAEVPRTPVLGAPAPQLSEVQGLVDSLQVRVAWKTGAKIRGEAVTSKLRIGRRPTTFLNGIHWSYVTEVHTNGASLTDHLIVSLVDGKEHV